MDTEMPVPQKICRPKSLTEIAVDEIREHILKGSFEMGSALSENQLAVAFGISRTPIRDALFRLEKEGLVQVRPQKGTFVFTVTEEEIRELCDFRTVLEMTALRYSIQRHPRAVAAELEAIVAAMVEAHESGDSDAYLDLDTAFHTALFRHCGNAYLSDAHQLIAAKMATLRNRMGANPDHVKKSFKEHAEIMEAVKRRDLETAERLLRGHVSRQEGSYWATVVGSINC